MRKGQTEMIGLVIIVILIVIIGVLALRFMMMNKTPEKNNALLSTKANNLMNAITKVDVCGKDFGDAVGDYCGNDGNDGCFEEEIEKIIGNFAENYRVEIDCSDGDKEINVNCDAGISSSRYTVKSDQVRYYVSVILC